jgi:hypothetical protein
MNTTNNPIEQVSEFSRTYSAESEPEFTAMSYERPSLGKGSAVSKARHFTHWDSWLNRGIPELASPLAE